MRAPIHFSPPFPVRKGFIPARKYVSFVLDRDKVL